MISNLGGSPQTLECPWCEGSGRFLPDHHPQARFRDQEGGDGADESGPESSPDAPA